MPAPDPIPNNANPTGPERVEELDLLVSRVVDGAAGRLEWMSIERLAAGDPGVWKHIALAQRDHMELSAAVAGASARAERVELPGHEPLRLADHREGHPGIRRAGTWLGWAAAAVLAVGFFRGMPGVDRAGPGANTASILPTPVSAGSTDLASLVSSPAEALDLYLTRGQQTGQVVGELPEKVLLEARPMLVASPAGSETATQGGYEVYYLRQIVERATVPSLYQFSRDDTGQVAVPVRLPIGRGSAPASGPM